MMKKKLPKKSRYLTLIEVADRIGYAPDKAPRERRRHVMRVFRMLEKRDKTKYLVETSPGLSGNRYTVCVDDLGRLDPWMPSTTQALRADLDENTADVAELSRRVGKVEDFCVAVSRYLKNETSLDVPATSPEDLN